MTPEERFKMGCAMSSFARDCGRFALRKKYPALTDVEIEQMLLLRMYGKELHPGTLEIALAGIATRGFRRSTR
jgi:hypothetical protein